MSESRGPTPSDSAPPSTHEKGGLTENTRRGLSRVDPGCITIVVVGSLVFVAVVFVVPFFLMWWAFSGEPEHEARDLYRAADEALSLPYVSRAEVHTDWFDGNSLDVFLTPKVTNGELRHLWCDVLLGTEGGWITVHQGYWNTAPRPKRKDCIDPSPSPIPRGAPSE